MDEVRKTRKPVPIFIDSCVSTAQATIRRTRDTVSIHLYMEGSASQIVAELLEQPEVIALKFTPLPVENITDKKERTN